MGPGAGRGDGHRQGYQDTDAHLVYVACEVIAGTARVTSAGEVDTMEWVLIGELATYVPGGF